VSRRPRRLRAAPEPLLRHRRRARRRLPDRKPRPRSPRSHRPRGLLAGCGRERALDRRSAGGRAELYHASPRDPVWEYVLAPEVAFLSLEATERPLVLVGHSHVALRFGDEELTLALGEDGHEVDLARERWLLNPGSVGQPRDGNPLAAWLLLDFDAQTAVYRRVEYPIAKTQAEIRERGLPEPLALRLESGV
jgi:diadenosine tetraphosphatase ApaH/serine/threonine PP2A family protein phosphatase